MSANHYEFQVDPKHEGDRIDKVLSDLLGSSRSNARRLLIQGAVYLNRRRIRVVSKLIRSGARLEVWASEPSVIDKANSEIFSMDSLETVFEDSDLIVVNKPAGLPSQPTLDSSRSNLFQLLQEKYDYVGMHHRLDSLTSGLMVFTLSKRANPSMAKQFKDRTIRKTYLALISGGHETPRKCPEKWEVKNLLAVDPSSPRKRSRFKSVQKGGKPSHTVFMTRVRSEATALVEAKPITGRTHQIRVHLSEAGFPIMGDRLYGGEEFQRLMLHAETLEFDHPVSGEKLRFQSELPKEFQDYLNAKGARRF